MIYGINGYRLNLICLSILSNNSSKDRKSMCTKSIPLFHLLGNGANPPMIGGCQYIDNPEFMLNNT